MDEEWQPEGCEFVSDLHFAKLLSTGKEVAWPRSEWDFAEEQGTYIFPELQACALAVGLFFIPSRGKERFISSRHPLHFNVGATPKSVQA